MRRCFYPLCKHTAKFSCKLHNLPANHNLCRRWMQNCGLEGTPRKISGAVYICGCHWLGGRGPTPEFPLPTPFKSPGFGRSKRTVPRNVPLSPLVYTPGSIVGNISSPVQSLHSSESELGLPASSSFDEKALRHFGSTPRNFSSHETSVRFNDGRDIKNEMEESEEKSTDIIPLVRDQALVCKLAPLSLEDSYSWTDDLFQYFTGISRNSFHVLFQLLGGDEGTKLMKYRVGAPSPEQESENKIHSNKGELFLTLVRLRRGFSVTDMSIMFRMCVPSISNIFNTWIRLMSIKFKSLESFIFVSVESQVENQPDCFEPFPNLRCVVDSTTICIQKPSNMEQQSNTWSTYKSSNVIKFQVAVSKYGGLSFISEGMEGSISDRKSFLKSGIMDYLNAGEAVMCDRGYDIEADLNEIEVDLIIPPFLGDRKCFTEREILLTKAIATSRIHVETFIGRMKFFKLIRQGLPNALIDVASDIVRVCANLVNLSDPFIIWKTKKKTKKK